MYAKRKLCVLISALLLSVGALADQGKSHDKTMHTDRASVDSILTSWAERPRLGAHQMLGKYGLPQEATSEQLIWHNAGPFKRITVMNLETPHDFPLPHVDYLEHTIVYNVPQDKVGALIEFDASSTINRTVGELSARCDLEGHNVLTLNLDHDIVTGKKTVEQARKAFGEIVGEDVMGKHPAYVEALQFEPMLVANAAFSDKPVIPGSPVRAADADADAVTAANSKMKGDAEVLASVIAIDLNEVLAAAEAQKKKISAPVMSYAKMLQEEHGLSMVNTMKLAQTLGITPIDTAAIEKMKKKGAGELATLITLEGNDFERAYLAAMKKGHAEALTMIDSNLIKMADNEALKLHLVESRRHIAAHLEASKQLEGAQIASAPN